MKKVLLFLFAVFTICSCEDEQVVQSYTRNLGTVTDEKLHCQVGATSLGDDVIGADSFLLDSCLEESMIMSRAKSPVCTWSSNVQVSTTRNVKVSFDSRYMVYLYPAVYVCKVYTITAVTTNNPNRIYFSADDDECGFKPTATNKDPIVRGTRAYDNSDGTYTLKTVCYKIISNLAGVTPSGDGYIPCDPYKALLKYKYFDMPTENNFY